LVPKTFLLAETPFTGEGHREDTRGIKSTCREGGEIEDRYMIEEQLLGAIDGKSHPQDAGRLGTDLSIDAHGERF